MNNNENKKFLIGNYFSDAVDWYCVKYLFCITERAWLLLIVFFLTVIFFISIANIYFLFPVSKDFTLVKYTERYSDEFSIMRKLDYGNEEIAQESVARYLIASYVEKYESYDYDNLTSQFNFVKNNSSRKVFLMFKEQIDFNKSDSRIIKYGTNIKRIISINKVLLDSSSSAVVMFQVRMIDKGVLLPNVNFHKASLNFSLSNIKMNAAGITPLEFNVQDYKSL